MTKREAFIEWKKLVPETPAINPELRAFYAGWAAALYAVGVLLSQPKPDIKTLPKG